MLPPHPGPTQGEDLANIFFDAPSWFGNHSGSQVRGTPWFVFQDETYYTPRTTWAMPEATATPHIHIALNPPSLSQAVFGMKGPQGVQPQPTKMGSQHGMQRSFRQWGGLDPLLTPVMSNTAMIAHSQPDNSGTFCRESPLTVGTCSTLQYELVSPSVSIPNKGCFHISLTLLL